MASLNQVGEQADRAAEIIRRLRRFVTKAKPPQTVVDMNALIRDVAELTNIDARMAKAEVCFELTEPLPPVVGDRIQTRTGDGEPDAQRLRGDARLRAASPAG